MLENYLSIFVFMVIGLLVGIAPIILSSLIGPSKPNTEKSSPYECGFPPFANARIKFDIKYYLIAILFIIFDLEITFLFPWAVVFKDLGLTGIIAMAIFLGLLIIGFIYEWKRGALEWE